MAAPASYDRVLAAMLRIFPFPVTITRPGGAPPAVGDSRIGRELGSIAWALARIVDRYDAMANELFPDTAVETLDRWEKFTRVATIASDPVATRQAKVLSVLRRLSGPRLDQLAKALAPVLGIATEDVQFREPLRVEIDPGMTYDAGIVTPLAIPTATDLLIPLGAPWPGKVDDAGVSIEIITSALGTPTYALEHPDGTSWAIPITAAAQELATRTVFPGRKAGSGWRLRMRNATPGVTVSAVTLYVSNDSDAGQIYNFFAYRNPALQGAIPDLAEANLIFKRTALGHMNTAIIQSTAIIADEGHGLVDRDPVGA